MTRAQARRLAAILAFVTPLALLGGAYLGQYGFGLVPCEMCWWQRYPHFAALVLGALALATRPPSRALTALAALAIAVSGLIGAFHAGVEYGWWEGITACTATVTGSGDPLQAILDAPLVRCDTPQWTLFDVSLAGWNFLFSCGAALAIALLLARSGKTAR